MNIQEATKLAMERGKSIYRSSEFETFRKPGDNLELLPTNSYGYVVVKPRQSLLSIVATNGRRLIS